MSKLVLGLFAGGLLSAWLSGSPDPSSPAGKFLKRLDQTHHEPPVLHYFDIRGRAEAIRVAFADKGIVYIDKPFTKGKWTSVNGSPGLKEKWTNEGKLMFGQVPRLEMDGFDLVQSHSIFRYVAAKHGWYDGYDLRTKANIDMAADGTEDIRKQLTAIKYDDGLKEEQKTAKYKAWFKESGPTWFGFYERLLLGNSEGNSESFLAGTSEPSHADYLLFDLCDLAEALGGEHATKLLKGLPSLRAWRKRIAARPLLDAYLQGPKRRDP